MQSILIVDDKPENLLALEKILERPGLNIVKATSGNQALGLLLDHDFALVLLDVMMPEMDGFETAELMRGNSETKHIPIIFVTAISKEQRHVFKGYESGAVDYLFKPLDPDILISKVNVFLELHQHQLKLKEMNQELHIARLEAELANRSKSQFLTNLSHDLRTPMNGVIGMTGLLLDTELTRQQQELVETVRTCADKLLNVINDILDFSKIEIRKLDLEILDFNLRTTLEDASDVIHHRAQEKNLEFVCLMEPDVPSLLQGDPGRLRQIVSYLAENAVKYTAKGEITLKVSLENEDQKSATVRFAISDTGIGIPLEKQKNLFDVFTKGEYIDRTISTGLGLTISKQLAHMMGGTIGVESQEGKGSTFWFTVNFAKQLVPPPVQNETITDISGIRVLIVDDNATNRRLLALLLDSWDCRYEEAIDGTSALNLMEEAVSSGDPFLIAILDMQMPGMNGETLGFKIKKHPRLKDTRLIMMTSTGRRGDAVRLEKIGFAAYLPKPVKQSLLYDCLVTVSSGKPATTNPENHRIITRHSIKEARRNKIRILLVEDNTTNQKAILNTLSKLGCRTDAVANGVEAVKALEEIPYDLVLMDTRMPEMDGYEATRQIREIEKAQREIHSRKSKARGIPIIAMTTPPDEEENKIYNDVGINDAIPKPVDPRNLLEVIEKWIAEPKGLEPQNSLVFDKKGLMDRVLDDEDLVCELINEFVQEIPQRLEELKKSLERGDTNQIRYQGHTIKGTSGNMGAIALQKVAARIEAAGQADDLETATLLTEQLRQQFDIFVAETSKLTPAQSTPPGPA